MENFYSNSDSHSENEYYDSDYEYEYNNYEYEPEEMSSTKYNIVLCQKYNERYHGISIPEMNFQYLTLFRFKKFDYLKITDIYYDFLNTENTKLEIAECIYLPTQHCVSIIKTFWLRLIQRKWKNIIKERKRIISIRMNPNSLKYKEIVGYWPKNCNKYPHLKGMLSELS